MAETTTLTLADFLLARIAEDEAAVEAIGYAANASPFTGLYSPARVLAECEAKRRIVEHATGLIADALIMDRTPYEGALLMMTLALPYAGHPDYREEWRPS